ncbi:hypothetical protein GJ654_16170 [Rhodoblastus acidophilus]|uniref:Uncharacterized protein n=1 Tax=Rhodoblastus acidophilus TaxID=1074 RepID=A0A6N8DPK6_RHOAC|nr:hypothetical protein [Rhodoblastus acidophilus]MCW2274576.1 hypothetical protein [Rhodoblastus acidophilus]MTV32522.1 hypothetical protein [Rhodoblastus acidophilus]
MDDIAALSPERLLALLHAVSGIERPSDDDPHIPYGPAGPVIRAALDRVSVFGQPTPEPWRTRLADYLDSPSGSAFGPRPEPWRELLAALLRQHPEIWEVIGGGPLGPVSRVAERRAGLMHAIGEEIVARAQLIQTVIDVTAGKADHGAVKRFVLDVTDDLCPPPPKPPFPWPFGKLTCEDIAVIAITLDLGAKQTASPALRDALASAASGLLQHSLRSELRT